jgi:hypothetical protein
LVWVDHIARPNRQLTITAWTELRMPRRVAQIEEALSQD